MPLRTASDPDTANNAYQIMSNASPMVTSLFLSISTYKCKIFHWHKKMPLFLLLKLSNNSRGRLSLLSLLQWYQYVEWHSQALYETQSEDQSRCLHWVNSTIFEEFKNKLKSNVTNLQLHLTNLNNFQCLIIWHKIHKKLRVDVPF